MLKEILPLLFAVTLDEDYPRYPCSDFRYFKPTQKYLSQVWEAFDQHRKRYQETPGTRFKLLSLFLFGAKRNRY